MRLALEVGDDVREGLAAGDSLAVNGVCLTVVECREGVTLVQLSPETLQRTNLGELVVGSRVNLEPALHVGDALGGHWVQGHVDATTTVVSIEKQGESRLMRLAMLQSQRRYLVEKGSVTLDGVSLTIAALTRDHFTVALIPYTLSHTTLGQRAPGDRVNIEVDILAKYVERQLAERQGEAG